MIVALLNVTMAHQISVNSDLMYDLDRAGSVLEFRKLQSYCKNRLSYDNFKLLGIENEKLRKPLSCLIELANSDHQVTHL